MAESQPLPEAPCGAEYLRAVLRSPVYEVAQVTPLQVMEKISSRLGNTILVKREDRQPVHSFKLRGAYAMIAGLTKSRKRAAWSRHQPVTMRRAWRSPPASWVSSH